MTHCERSIDSREAFNSKIKPMFRKTHDPICAKCGRYRSWGKGMHIHHIKALVDGGTNEEKNLVVLCDICHSEYHITDPDFDKWVRTPPGALVELAMEKDTDLACYLIKKWEEIKDWITFSTMLDDRVAIMEEGNKIESE